MPWDRPKLTKQHREMLRAERQRRKLSLRQVAAEVGAPHSCCLYTYEIGKFRPRPKVLERWAGLLELNLSGGEEGAR